MLFGADGSLVWSSFVFALVRLQEVGVLRSLLPTSLFQHLSICPCYPHTDTQDHTNAPSMLSRFLWQCHRHVCVIVRLCVCLHELAHAAGHGLFFGATMYERSCSFDTNLGSNSALSSLQR